MDFTRPAGRALSVGIPDVPPSGDLVTSIKIEPNRLGRLLDAAALWTSPDKTLPGVQAIIVRIATERVADRTMTTVRAVGTDRYRLIDVRATLGPHESISGDPVMHDLWIPAPIARGLAKDLRAMKWPSYARAPEQRVIELTLSRRAYTHASLTSLPAPFDGMCARAGRLHYGEFGGYPVGQPSEGDDSFRFARSFMRLADTFAAAEPIDAPDAGEPFALNSRLLADLDKVAPCAKSQVVRPWSFQPVRTSTRTTAVRVVPQYSPYPTDPQVDLDILGHIMPVRLGDKR